MIQQDGTSARSARTAAITKVGPSNDLASQKERQFGVLSVIVRALDGSHCLRGFRASARTGRFFAKGVRDTAGRHFDPNGGNGGFTDIYVIMVKSARTAAIPESRGLLRVVRVPCGTTYSARVRVL